jgi:eukaryotic-like serine/threonine-protein kinase
VSTHVYRFTFIGRLNSSELGVTRGAIVGCSFSCRIGAASLLRRKTAADNSRAPGRLDVIGRTLSHYRINAAIGKGGMGDVYRATDSKLGREVALKVLPPDVASDPERLARFQREAHAVAALNHPHIVTIHSVEEADGVQFLTMELVEGQALDGLIPPGGLPLEQIVGIARR